MNDLDDVFDTDMDERETEKILAANEYQRKTEKISKVSYSEGFFATCENEIREKYDEGFLKGTNYSIEFGKILGRIDAYISITNELKLINLNDDSVIEELKSLRGLAESYQKELNEDVIKNLNEKADFIINNNLEKNK